MLQTNEYSHGNHRVDVKEDDKECGRPSRERPRKKVGN